MWTRGSYHQARRGHVYVHEEPRPDGRGSVLLGALGGSLALMILGGVVLVASERLSLPGGHDAHVAAGVVAAAAALLVWVVYAARHTTARRRLVAEAYRVCGEQVPPAEELARLGELRAAAEPLPDDVAADVERAYRQLVELIVADGEADDDELARLCATEEALALAPERIRAVRLQGFLDVYDAAIEDGVLTEEEQRSIEQVRAALGVPEALVRKELAFAKQLEWARRAKSEPLRPVPVTFRLREGEQAVHFTSATELEKRDGRGDAPVWEPVRSGSLYVTTERVVHAAESTVSVPLAHIREAGVEAERKHLTLVRDGRKTPYYFGVSQPYVTLAYLERVLGQDPPGAAPD